MSKVIINKYEDLEAFLGKKIGESEYHTITQDQINKFAEATLDHQWIHVDPEKAKTDSPFGTTIAHGYLTLSMITHLWLQIVEVHNVKMMVNYGIENLRFGQSVAVGSRVKLHAEMLELKNLRGITRAHMKATLEVEGSKKPAFEGTIVFLYHFNE